MSFAYRRVPFPMLTRLTTRARRLFGQDLYEEVRKTPGLSITFLPYSSYSVDKGCFEGGSREGFIEDLRRMGAKNIKDGQTIRHFTCLLCGEKLTSARNPNFRPGSAEKFAVFHYCDANPNGPGKKLTRNEDNDSFVLKGRPHLHTEECAYCKEYRSPHLKRN